MQRQHERSSIPKILAAINIIMAVVVVFSLGFMAGRATAPLCPDAVTVFHLR